MGEIAYWPGCFNTKTYGLVNFEDLFTYRQLTVLTTFSKLVQEAVQRAENDALTVGMKNDATPLAEEGCGAKAYGQAIGVYLAFIVDKLADYNSSICSWHNSGEKIRNTFGRQAIPMIWDYAESNPFCDSSGSINNMVNWIYKCLINLPTSSQGCVLKHDAKSDNKLRNIIISTDPPYYNNIGYSDLSDYFYIWMRQSLKGIFPQIFSTMLAPKKDELVAISYRFDGDSEKAKQFFEEGMSSVCQQLHLSSCDNVPVTIYYAYKQHDIDNTINDDIVIGSTGWETMLAAIINAGFSIVGTWPVRTECISRIRALGANALASSIVIVCRKRPADACTCTRRDFINALKRELPQAMEKLLHSNIAPVDLAQSAIGPGMGIFSRYSRVLEADGYNMTVRSALHCINEELGSYVGVDNLDAESHFCLDLYQQYAFNDMKFGDADQLARAKNTAVETLKSHGVVYAEKGFVHLVDRPNLPKPQQGDDAILWLFTQQLAYALEKDGVQGCAEIIARLVAANSERAKSLAYRLYTIADHKGWAAEALAYNALITSWQEIMDKVAQLRNVRMVQGNL